MADRPLTEVVSRQQMDFLNVADDLRRAGTLDPRKPDSWPQHMKDRRQVIDAARKWAELEALVADGARVVVEKPCPTCGFTGVTMSEAALQKSGDPQVDCPRGGWSEEWVQVCAERRVILGEGAEQ